MKKYQTINYVEFGKRIAKRRKELLLTQASVAERIDCSETYISRIETGNAKPSLDFLALLVQVLEANTDELIPEIKIDANKVCVELQRGQDPFSPELLLFLKQIMDAIKNLEENIRMNSNNN